MSKLRSILDLWFLTAMSQIIQSWSLTFLRIILRRQRRWTLDFHHHLTKSWRLQFSLIQTMLRKHGLIVFIGSTLVLWLSRRQGLIASSTYAAVHQQRRLRVFGTACSAAWDATSQATDHALFIVLAIKLVLFWMIYTVKLIIAEFCTMALSLKLIAHRFMCKHICPGDIEVTSSFSTRID